MRVLVYGGGAVGLGIASCLLRSGGAVDIVALIESNITFDNPVPSGGIPFAAHPELSYCFSRRSQIEPTMNPDVARIIIYDTRKIDPANPEKGAIYELMFGL